MSGEKGKSTLVPKLRFPKFRWAEGWTAPKLGSIGSFTGGGTPSKDKAIYWSGENPWVSSSDISEDGIQDISVSRYISNEAIQETATKIVPANSILLVSRVGVGKLAISRAPICTSQDFTNFTPVKDDLVFLAYCIKSLKVKLLAFNQGMAIKGFTKDDVSNLAVPLPTVAEQQKIADCLSSLDELLAAQARKVDALKTHKKGLMQQLFPREGETQPRLRFPEFRDAGEWEVKELEGLAKRGSGHTPSKSNPEYYGDGIKWVSLADSKRLDNGLVSRTAVEISKLGIKNSSAVLHPAGSVLISRDAGVGKSAVMEISMAVSQHFIVWTCNQHRLSNWFLYYLLQKMKPVFERIATGSTIKTIGLPFFKQLSISVPSISEQQRIATCLTSLDDLITAQIQALETLKTHKKGLMQQLFPAAEVSA